jgi:hypothetical protein
MNPKEFSEFRHDAVHALKHLNETCEREFRISSWPRWNYDFERRTLTFSQDEIAKVIATIQVVGTTSDLSSTWLWGWANKHLPPAITASMENVKLFGETEGLVELAGPSAPDDEHLGWAMTAIAAKILGAKGAYRCPDDNGFVYLVYMDIAFADLTREQSRGKQIECSTHGKGYQTYVCEHLISNPVQEWFSEDPSEIKEWPDAWCAMCNAFFDEEGEWNEKNSPKIKIELLCHHCYEGLRSQALPG